MSRVKIISTIGVSSKKGASETFGIGVIFCLAYCGVILQRRSDLMISSYLQENSLSGRVKRLYMT